jgi:predicted transcriptional regulator
MTAPQDELFSMDYNAVVGSTSALGRSRRLSPKQAAIMGVVNKQGSITLDEATELVGGNVYHNSRKHTGALLANMVNRGLLARQKAGVFSRPNDEAHRLPETAREQRGGGSDV